MSKIASIKTPQIKKRLPASPGRLHRKVADIVERIEAAPARFSTIDLKPHKADLDVLQGLLKPSAKAADRRAAAAKVHANALALATLVQGQADTLPAEDAAALIVAAGFALSRAGQRPIKPDFAVKRGQVSGSVDLIAKAVRWAQVYHFEYSTDQQTWVKVQETHKCRVRIEGLTPGQLVHFRFHAFTREGHQDLSQVISLIVV